MSKTKKITIGVVVSALLIAIIVFISIYFYVLTHIGRSNRNSIIVDSCYGDCTIEIPVKMRKGVYSPNYNAFGSELTVSELAELTSRHTYKDTSYDVTDYGDRALIKAKKNNNVVGFAVLIDRGLIFGETIRFALTDCSYTINCENRIYGVLIPWHLVDKGFMYGAYFNDVVKLDKETTIEQIIDFYSIGGHYTVKESGSVITVDTNGLEKYASFEMVFDPTTETLRYIFKE